MKAKAGSQALVLTVLFLVSLLGEVDYQIIPPLLPLLAAGFEVKPGYVGGAVTAYALSAAVATLIFGYLSDRLGRKPFIQFGLLGLSVSALASFGARSAEMFWLARALAGISAGSFATCVTIYAADYFHYGQRGRAMGILSAAYFGAAIIGIPSAVFVAGRWGWRPIYLVNASAAVILALLVRQSLPPSSLLNSPGPSSLAERWRSWRLPSACLQQRGTVALLGASLLSSGAMVGFITYLGSHLHGALHLSMQRVGLIFLWCGLASLVGAPLAGTMADRLGKKALLVGAGVALAICLLAVPYLPASPVLWVGLALTGMAMAFRMAPMLALLTELVAAPDRGTLLALRNTLSQLGIAAASLVSAYCYSVGGYKIVGGFTATLIVISTLLVAFLVKEPHDS